MKLPSLAASALVAPGKGILAADESIATMSARLSAAGIVPSQRNRRAFRELLITTPGLATGHLAALQHFPHVWPLTFAFGRALAGPALAAWHGEPGHWRPGQRALAGRYRPEAAPGP